LVYVTHVTYNMKHKTRGCYDVLSIKSLTPYYITLFCHHFLCYYISKIVLCFMLYDRYIKKMFQTPKSKKINQHGFTLIELLVIIAVIGIMSTIMFVNFRDGQAKTDIREDGFLILDGLKRMQTMSLAGELVEGSIPLEYEFFIDNCASGCSSYTLRGKIDDDPLTHIPIETVDLNYSNLTVAGVDEATVGLEPPRARININTNVGSNLPNITFKLTHSLKPSYTVCVKVSKISGRMDLINCP